MSLQSDLLRQSRHLATREPKKPRQASLRRAVSTAYYALFHLLVDEASRLLVGTSTHRRLLRLTVRRAFAHRNMADVAKSFAGSTLPDKLKPALDGHTIQPELARLAVSFADLQQARHDADYDIVRTFTRAEALDLIEQAERAFDDWKSVKGTPQAVAFLVALLLMRELRS